MKTGRDQTLSDGSAGLRIAIVTSEREARSEFLLIYTKNLSMSGRPAGPPARRPAGRPWSRF